MCLSCSHRRRAGRIHGVRVVEEAQDLPTGRHCRPVPGPGVYVCHRSQGPSSSVTSALLLQHNLQQEQISTTQ